MAIGDGDIDNLLSNGDFDVCGEFTLASGSTLCVNGIFTGGTDQVNLMSQDIEAVNPMFDVASDAVADVRTGNTVVIDGDSYIVERKQVLGTGITTIHLKTKRA